MRKLHLVGVSTDLKGLIFTARKGSKSGGYLVALDRKLTEAVEDAARRNGRALPIAGTRSEAPVKAPTDDGGAVGAAGAVAAAEAADGRAHSALSPREMQARMRAGRSIEEVALEAGVGADWVARFAVPILAEQAQVVALARGITFAKPRLGPSALPLGEAVARNLVEKGHSVPDDLFDPAWSAFQLHDSVWTVRFRHEVRGRSYEAQWEIDVATGRLLARNRVASDLGYVDPGGRKSAGEDGIDPHPGPSTDDPQGLARPSQSGARSTPASRGPKPKKPTGGSTRRRPDSSASADTSGEETGPVVRGGGIRAATAQVTTAQVAASRSLVARTVLPAPRPSAVRGGGARASSPDDFRRGAVEVRDRSQPAVSGNGEKKRSSQAESRPDESFIGELMRDSSSEPSEEQPRRQMPVKRDSPARRSNGGRTGNGSQPNELRPVQARSRRPDSTVTRVRSGGPTGLVRTTSSPTGAGRERGEGATGARSAGSRQRAADTREPVRVPSVLSPASSSERNMPAPRGRSRRLLRRTR